MQNNTDISERINATHDTLKAMVHQGKVPDVDASSWLVELIEHMNAASTVVEHAGLLTTADYGNSITVENAPPLQNEAVINFQPLSQALLNEQQRMSEEHGSRAIHVLGADPVVRDRRCSPKQKQDSARANADAYVASTGDLYSALEMLKILSERFQSADAWNAPPLIINNENDFWTPLLNHVGLIDEGQLTDPALQKNISVVRGKEEVNDALLTVDATRSGEPPKAAFELPRGSTIFVATKTASKIQEIKKVFEPQGVHVRRLEYLTNFNNPEEISRTYSGNLWEKLGSAIATIKEAVDIDGNIEPTKKLLELNGINPEHCYVLSEDSGIEFVNSEGIFDHLPTGGFSRGLVLNDKQFPGQEFGPALLSKLGEHRFFSECVEAIAARDGIELQKGVPLSEQQLPDEQMAQLMEATRITNSSVMGLAPLFADKGQRPVYTFSARTQGRLALERYGEHSLYDGMEDLSSEQETRQGEVINARDWMIPALNNEQQLTERELGETYDTDYSCKAKVGNTIMAAGKTASRAIEVPEKAADNKFSVACVAQHALALTDTLKAALNGDAKEMNFLSSALHSERDEDGNLQWQDTINQIVEKSDAMVLMPKNKEQTPEQNYQDMYSFFSLIVAKQITPHDMDKPYVVVNDDGCWNDMLDIYNDLRRTSLLPDTDKLLVKEVKDVDEVKDVLDEHRREYWRGERAQSENTTLREAKDSNQFNVAIFCSASTRNEFLVSETEQLSYDLAMDDFGLVYGAGKKEMMGAVYTGAKRAAADKQDDVYIAGSSTTDILKVEVGNEADSRAFTDSLEEMGGDYFHAKDIYQRMDYMIKTSDAFAIMPGGAGTVQELAALLMLKSQDAPSMRDKPIIIYNKPTAEGSEHGFYDTVLPLIPEEEREKLGIKIVTREEDLKPAFAEARRAAEQKVPDGQIKKWAHQMLKPMQESMGSTIH